MTLTYKICNRCIMDTSVPGIRFNQQGICNFCEVHDNMEKSFPNDDRGKKILVQLAHKIKKSKGNAKYDCIIGISGGRDSTFTLHYVKTIMGLNPLAVHFNDGFSNPVAGENMIKACRKLNIELRTITSDWRESKDIRIAFMQASTPDLGLSTDIGIATALYGIAAKENVRNILIGQSFRTEGIAPLSWNFLDGKYLKAVHKKFGTVPLRAWKPNDPGFNLGIREMFYYSIIRRIKVIPILYYQNYIRSNTDELISKEYGWINPGAHYYDDLYQSLMSYVLRVKFNINRRLFNYSALVRSGQMSRDEALTKSREAYVIEDPKIIDLCIKRLGITKKDFDHMFTQPVKTFRDYPNSYSLIRLMRFPIWVLSKLHLLPGSAYDKYFNCGK